MKSNVRSQTFVMHSFPATATKGGDTGNEKISIKGQGIKISFELPKGFCGTATKLCHGFMNYSSFSVPFIAKVRFSRDHFGRVLTGFHLLKLAKLRTRSKRAGREIMLRHFPSFYKAAEQGTGKIAQWEKALAVDCASIFKNPAELGEVIIKKDEWRIFLNAIRKNRKTDELDYLMANEYEKEGWNKLPLAQVGKIAAKRLGKKRPVPTSTLNRRLADLGFASLPVGRPETKYK